MGGGISGRSARDGAEILFVRLCPLKTLGGRSPDKVQPTEIRSAPRKRYRDRQCKATEVAIKEMVSNRVSYLAKSLLLLGFLT